jgi:hypothetical protein
MARDALALVGILLSVPESTRSTPAWRSPSNEAPLLAAGGAPPDVEHPSYCVT